MQYSLQAVFRLNMIGRTFRYGALVLGVWGQSNAQTITTVAGTGMRGVGGDGGAATSAQLSFPAGVGLDAKGNLYIADLPVNRIRRVDAATGIITRVAGTGDGDLSGDGGAATSARLFQPTDVALDAVGNLYIADMANSRIRRVDATTGIITTVAGRGTDGYAGAGPPGFSGDGGPATDAYLNRPYGIALDAKGNLYIADSDNIRVRRVDVATGVITTVAGTGTKGFSGDGGAATSAQLNSPGDVALDAVGNLYIVDNANSRIRRVDATTGIITTIAGTGAGVGTGGFSGDGGAATKAQLNDPSSIALDVSGNLYISDSGNQRIRRIDAITGIITTVAGTGNMGFSGDGGAATSAQLFDPFGIALSTGGSLYIADYADSRVRRVSGPPLPVQLTSFSVSRYAEQTVGLDWQTSQESGADYFEVQRSNDAQEFIALGRVAAQGTTTRSHTYRYLDYQPLLTTTYYRLRQVDLDGSQRYSTILAISAQDNAPLLKLVNNPVSGGSAIGVWLRGIQPQELALYSLSGQRIGLQIATGQSGANIELRSLVPLLPGHYLLRGGNQSQHLLID